MLFKNQNLWFVPQALVRRSSAFSASFRMDQVTLLYCGLFAVRDNIKSTSAMAALPNDGNDTHGKVRSSSVAFFVTRKLQYVRGVIHGRAIEKTDERFRVGAFKHAFLTLSVSAEGGARYGSLHLALCYRLKWFMILSREQSTTSESVTQSPDWSLCRACTAPSDRSKST